MGNTVGRRISAVIASAAGLAILLLGSTAVASPASLPSGRSGDVPITAYIRDGNVWVGHGAGDPGKQVSFSGRESSPVLSPDGSRVAYLTANPNTLGSGPTPEQLCLVVVQTTDTACLGGTALGRGRPAWNPQGTQVAVTEGGVLVVVEVGDLTRRIIASGSLVGSVSAPEPAWSADGQRLACQLALDDSVGLWVFDLRTGTRTQLLRDLLQIDSPPRFSPDGSKVAFIDVRHDDRLTIVDIDAGSATTVPLTSTSSFDWSPVNGRLALVRSEDSIWEFDPESEVASAILTMDRPVRGWSIAWTEDGTGVLLAAKSEGDSSVAYVPLPEAALQPIRWLDPPETPKYDSTVGPLADLSVPYRYQGESSSGACKSVNCGPTVVAMAIQHALGQWVAISDVRAFISGATCRVTNVADLVRALDNWGVSHATVSGMDAVRGAVNDRSHAVIVPVLMLDIAPGSDYLVNYSSPTDRDGRFYEYTDGHFVIVKGISSDGNWVIVHDPNVWDGNGKYWYSDYSAKGQSRYYSYSSFVTAFAHNGNQAIEILTTPPVTCNPNVDQVSLYVDSDYGGQCATKGIGDYTSSSAIGLPNDSISSIRVGSNVKATLCKDDNYGGGCEDFTGDDANLSDNSVGNDQVSSAKVQPRSTPPPSGDWRVEYFSDTNLGTRCGPDGALNGSHVFMDIREDKPDGACPADNWSARYTRRVSFPGGRYTFGAESDDWSRIYVDGDLVVNRWQGQTQKYSDRDLAAGDHDVRVEFADTGGNAWLQAWWRGPGFSMPNENPDPNQWFAAFWGVMQKDSVDPVIKVNIGTATPWLDWGNEGPGYGLPSDRFASEISRNVDFSCGRYQFQVWTDDGARLMLDGTRVIDKWQDGAVSYYADVDLSAGPHSVKVEHYENQGAAHIGIVWTKLSNCITPPPPPSPLSPPNGTVYDEGQSVALAWSATGDDYYGEVWGGPAGTIPINWQSGTTKDIGSQWSGYTYSWHVKARNSAGESGWSGTQTFAVKPAAPTGLTAQATACNRVSLSWTDRSGNEEGFKVYRNGAPIGQTVANVTSYVDNGPNGGTAYSYQVVAFRSSIASDGSNTAAVTTPACPCGVPFGYYPNGDRITQPSTINFGWMGNCPKYYAEYWGGPAGTIGSGWQSALLWNPGSLWIGSYFWHVRGKQVSGVETAWSTTLTFTVVPAMPTDLQATAVSPSEIALIWTDAAGDKEGYKIYLGDGTYLASSTGRAFAVGGLACETSYSFYVKTYKGAYESDPSNTASATTTTCPLPAVPVPVSPGNGTTVPSGSPATLNWNASSWASEYLMEWWEGTGAPSRPCGWQTARSCQVSPLVAGHAYSWHVKARNSAGESAWSPTWTFIADPFVLLGQFTVGCSSEIAIGPVNAREFKFQMLSGGGGDNRIGFYASPSDGASWLVNGAWLHVTDQSRGLNVGEWRETPLFSTTSVSRQRFSVGCSDGESMTVAVYYLPGAATPTVTPVTPTVPPTVPPSDWQSLGQWTVGCDSDITFGAVNARQFKFQMLSGGGGDNRIGFYASPSSGASWLVNGDWLHVTDQSRGLNVGEWRQTPLFNATSADRQRFSVGCNDGETAVVAVYYLTAIPPDPITPVPTHIFTPTPTPGGGWTPLGQFTVGCNSEIAIGPITARQFRFQMLSGGGSDNRIGFYASPSSGASWLVNGAWLHVTNQSRGLNVGEWRETPLFAATSVNRQRFSVGCNDGETMTVLVQYYADGAVPTVTPTAPPAGWQSLGQWNVDCNSDITFAAVSARQFKFQMLSGGGGDNRIALYANGSGGASWFVNGAWLHVSNQSGGLNVGEWRETPLFAATFVNRQRFSLGCSDGETAVVDVFYLKP